jgi:hypothetical protein
MSLPDGRLKPRQQVYKVGLRRLQICTLSR